MSTDPKDTSGSDLARYREKRSAGGTPEPMGSAAIPAAAASPRGGAKLFVVHQHDATRMHWDLRLEIDGVLCSWAVPKAPSMDPDDKRLAVKVENHPLEYVHFEAVIPDGNYGAGPMIAWDRGVFRPLMDAAQGMADGEIKFELYGYKLRGAFTLVHTGKGTRGRRSGRGSNDWLLIKKRDAPAEEFLARGEPLSGASVLSGLTIDELEARAPKQREVVAEIDALGAPKRTIDPKTFEPMLCHTADAAFSSDDWVYELKYDGFRLVAFGGAGRAELRYRSGTDVTARFPEIASVVRALPIADLVLDGEVVVLDADGKPSFQELATRAQMSRASEIERAALSRPVTYVAFDLLAAAGFDLRARPLVERKAFLKRIVPTVGPMRYSDHVEGRGEDFLAAVVAQGLEGVVAKKKTSPYRNSRSRDWLKLKRDPEADFAVCGFTPPKGSRTGLGALHLCIWVDERWVYAGKVGSGFDDALLAKLSKQLMAKPAWRPTFPRPEGSSDARWIEPELVVQVRYREWPPDSTLRFPVFVRLRDDKRPQDCGMPKRTTADSDEREEVAPAFAPDDAPQRELRLTRLHKELWPDDHITKGELVDYYRSIAPHMLPYLRDRPMVLTRFPDGITGEMFYQKDLPEWAPPWLRTTTTWSEHSEREIHYLLLDDADGLAYVANLASIPIHAWASRVGSLELPDWTIIDLDPKNAPREHVVPLALAIHELCEDIGLPNFVKTSGQTGLHVLVPLAGQCTFDQARDLAYLIGMIIERRHPTMATTARNPAARGGRVYLDWGQNARGQLLVAPFSVRPVPGAPVSMPLRWDEVVPHLDPKQFNLKNALARANTWEQDPFIGVLSVRPDLKAALEALGKHASS